MSIPRPVRMLVLADVVLAAVHVLNAALGHPYATVTRMVDLDGEANIPT